MALRLSNPSASFIFFFASPPSSATLVGMCHKKETNLPAGRQERSPTNEYSPFVGSSYVELLYYCGFNIDNLPASRQVLLLGAVA
jgi:hypothetical protein